ncbi:acyl-CoA dehydrogenase family protein [Chelatococcus asaccharovorans]|uniref:Alkylation response protein AidB-like acyl-CoA dehydrogenase n=1 Tax=Chelatococcus asaccharovorans TaxID=28210 RepID=A0A2V3U2H8_9HYPH|nr:acyl-CoA dehydrogenase family protein [Chelatococcus asaccharovorans]MBS7702177.1 acyl-CoA/acyl-ACP dehydrogenase [Chelatococcus asaccharovorans]PXW56625.1 alkylation response protein AidB-like acyl-CoA dehydrogenase [Chelatococcus asaccharovorans]
MTAVLQKRQPASPPPSIEAIAQRLSMQAARRAEDLDDDETFPAEDIAGLVASGMMAAPLPEALGGRDLGIGRVGVQQLATVLSLLGRGNLSVGQLYEGHVRALKLVLAYGTKVQRESAAADAHAGHLFGLWTVDGREPLRLGNPTTGGKLVGAKIQAAGAGYVTRPLITAQRSDGRTQLVLAKLPLGARASLASWRAHGMRASASGTVDFTGFEVDRAALIGEPGAFGREPLFSASAWRVAAVQLGGIEALFDALRLDIRQSGSRDNPLQLARAGEAAIAAETARLWVQRAALMAENPEGEAEAKVAYVQLARLAVERAGADVIARAHHAIGLPGFMRPHAVERLTRDLETYLRQPDPDGALTRAGAHVVAKDTPGAALWR